MQAAIAIGAVDEADARKLHAKRHNYYQPPRITSGADILDRLDKVSDKGGGQYMACCPAHGDKSPSLSVKIRDDGRVLIHCFAGCDTESILNAMGLAFTDLFPDRPKSHRYKPTRSRISPRDALTILDREAMVVGVIAGDILEHREVDEATFDWLAQAIARIGRVRGAGCDMSDQSDRISRLVGEADHSGAVVLDDTRDFIRRFCVFPDSHSLVAVTLWAAHTHAVDEFYSTPRLAVISAVLSSGKTRVLEILNLLVDSPMFAFNASPATVYRRLNDRRITLLFDEVDTVWTSRGRDDDHADLRALLNAGYKRGAVVPRCVGPKHDVVDFDVFCPVAMAGIGELPETIMSRSVVIKMRRRSPSEKVEPYRDRIHDAEGHALRDRLASWVGSIAEAAGSDYPDLPPEVVDRPAEVWEPLITIADQAGGEWPTVARQAATHLCKVAEDRRVTLEVRLLQDLRTIFGDEDKLPTATIIERLTVGTDLDDDAPWADLRGKAIDSRKVASLLRPFGIRSRNIQVGGQRPKGYLREDLYESWQRYLPPVAEEALQALHGLQANNDAGSSVAAENNVADTSATSDLSATSKANNGAGSADVADVADFPPQGSAQDSAEEYLRAKNGE
jgi:hypothetical protein